MLEIRAVSKTFNPGTPNELRALQAIDLTVNNGSSVVIIGNEWFGKIYFAQRRCRIVLHRFGRNFPRRRGPY